MKAKLLGVVAVLPSNANSGVQATTIDGSFSGTVYAGTEVTDLFGLGFGASLVGQTISGTFSYNSAGVVNVNTNGHTHNYSYGAPLTITATINGFSQTVTADTSHDIYNSQITSLENAYQGITEFFVYAVSGANNIEVTSYCVTAHCAKLMSNIHDIGSVNFAGIPGDTGGYFADFQDGTGFYFNTTSMQAANETPLPAALPLFATGLGVMGLLGWRRKRKSSLPLRPDQNT
jgi:hypothetical protein